MLFTQGNVKRSSVSSSIQNLVFVSKNTQNQGIPKNISVPSPQISQTEPELKKSYWGKPTWYLFHTLAEKVKEEMFLQIKNEMFNIINIICINLPCPICANHAKKYMEDINPATIKTKQQFKEMLFHFHNSVNLRKNYPPLPLEQLDVIYSRANLSNIIQHFLLHFRDKSRNIRMISNEMYRNMVVKQVSNWLSKHAPYFYN
jgi:uncharacterized membrane protein YheB (UPF0754 family)